MPLEFGLWRVDEGPVRVVMPSMPLESRLEELKETDPRFWGPLLLIGHGKFVDLLGMDVEGGHHVLELKRDRTPREVVAQLLNCMEVLGIEKVLMDDAWVTPTARSPSATRTSRWAYASVSWLA